MMDAGGAGAKGARVAKHASNTALYIKLVAGVAIIFLALKGLPALASKLKGSSTSGFNGTGGGYPNGYYGYTEADQFSQGGLSGLLSSLLQHLSASNGTKPSAAGAPASQGVSTKDRASTGGTVSDGVDRSSWAVLTDLLAGVDPFSGQTVAQQGTAINYASYQAGTSESAFQSQINSEWTPSMATQESVLGPSSLWDFGSYGIPAASGVVDSGSSWGDTSGGGGFFGYDPGGSFGSDSGGGNSDAVPVDSGGGIAGYGPDGGD